MFVNHSKRRSYMSEKFHNKPFDEATKLKLEIFGECFREWLPVFIYNKSVSRAYIYDFFAGQGQDPEGYPGSPLILLNEAKGMDCEVCNAIDGKEIVFGFNDKHMAKDLKEVVSNQISKCITENCKASNCKYKWAIGDYEFKDAFNRDNVRAILNEPRFAKFVLLDQFGFNQVDEIVFNKLVKSPKTDFIFFIASSFINRFKDHPYVVKYFDTSKIQFTDCKPKERHRLIAEYFEHLVNLEEYYIHHFTIKKGSNYYGLIFGTSHTYGMEKFLKVCWKKDEFSGESTENNYDDYENNTLFYNPELSNKKENVKKEIIEQVLNGTIKDNISGFKFTLKRRCLPDLFTKTIIELEKENKIARFGDVNNQSSRIHEARKYFIEVIKNEKLKN